MNRRKLVLLGLILVLVLLHLALVPYPLAQPERFQVRDSLDYLDLAQTMLATGSYRGSQFPEVDLSRPPGYPTFLALGLMLGRGNLGFIPLLQVLLTLLIALLLYGIGNSLGRPNLGLVAVLFYLLNPNATFWSLIILSETLVSLWLAVAVWTAIRYWQTDRLLWFLLSGLSLGLAALTRPIALTLTLPWAAFFLWYRNREGYWLARKNVTAVLTFSLGVLVILLPWYLRNYSLHGQFTLSTIGGHTWENWILANTLASAEGIDRQEAVAQINQTDNPLFVIQRYPAVFVREQAKGIFRTALGAEYGSWALAFSDEEIETTGILNAMFSASGLREILSRILSGDLNRWTWAGFYALFYDLLLFGSILAGCWRILKLPREDPLFGVGVLLVISLVLLIVVPLGAGQSRFRVPADPLLALLAAAGWAGRPRDLPEKKPETGGKPSR